MKYFTREQHNNLNSGNPLAIAAAMAEFEHSSDLYRQQLHNLKPKLSEPAWAFFDSESLHDGTLLVLRVGDDIDKLFPTYQSSLVNRRHLSVEMQVLVHNETRLYTLRYDRLHRVAFDFPSGQPWYFRYGDRASNPIDDWLFDELTAVDGQVLRHEVLFSSGTTLLIEFEELSVASAEIEGRQGLPCLDPADAE